MQSTRLAHRSRILVIDDHSLFREGLVRTLNREKDLEVCGEASDQEQALAKVAAMIPDMAIVDIALQGNNGIELTKHLRSRFPKLRILVLSMHKESIYAYPVLRAGANGYIMKRQKRNVLLTAVRKVLSGNVYVSPAANEMVLQRMSHEGRYAPALPIQSLNHRELEIFQLVGEGNSNRQIANKLNISVKNAERRCKQLREKLNLSSTHELLQQAIQWTRNDTDFL